MSSTAFPNGQTLVSDALTPQSLLTLLQQLTVGILGINPTTDPQAYSKVRIDWPKQGQPAWDIDEDRCFLSAVEADELYSKFRDIAWTQNTATTLKQTITYQRTWDVSAVFYGPNAFDHARLLNDALFLDWVGLALQPSNLFLVTDMRRPMYAPELFSGQWWQRADLRFSLNEGVTATITDNAIASAEVLLEPENGKTIDIIAAA